MTFPASVQRWRLLWLPASLIRRLSGQARDFSAWMGSSPSRTPAATRTGSAYQQTRRPLSAQPVHDPRARRDPLCQNPRYKASALAHGIAGAATHEGRGHRARQQDRQDGVGHDGQGRSAARTGRTRGVNEIPPTIRREVKVGTSEQHVMQSRSIRRSDNPKGPEHCRMRAIDRDLIRGGHMASGQ